MEWYIWLGIIGGLIVYLGLGNIVTGLIDVLKKKGTKKGKPKEMSRLESWALTLFWPLFLALALIILGSLILLLGFVIGILLAIVALALSVGGFLITLGLTVTGGLLGFVILAITVIMLLFIILSPIFGLSAIKEIITKFNPSPQGSKEKT